MKAPVFDPGWPEDVVAVYRHDMQEIWDPNIAPHVWNQYHNQIDLYLRIADARGDLSILDVGCAQGTLALLLAERGQRVWALDIRPQFLEYAKSRHERGQIHFVCGNAMEIEFGRTFDLIFANQLVEHLVHPVEFASRLKRWLVPGGRLVMTTPNGAYFMNSLPRFSEVGGMPNVEERQFTADGDGHFFAYYPDELQKVLADVGFGEISISYFETPWISGHMKLRYLHPILPPSLLRICDRATLQLPWLGVRFAHQLMVQGTNI